METEENKDGRMWKRQASHVLLQARCRGILATGHWPLATRKLARSGQLVPGRSFSWQWKVCDRQVAGIHVRVTVQALNLCCQKRWRIH